MFISRKKETRNIGDYAKSNSIVPFQNRMLSSKSSYQSNNSNNQHRRQYSEGLMWSEKGSIYKGSFDDECFLNTEIFSFLYLRRR